MDYDRPQDQLAAALDALALIAASMRQDGTWNRDRDACRQLGSDAGQDRREAMSDTPRTLPEAMIWITALQAELAAAREQRDQAIRAAKAIQVELFKYQDANDLSVWCDCDDHGAACARGLYHPPGHVTCRY